MCDGTASGEVFSFPGHGGVRVVECVEAGAYPDKESGMLRFADVAIQISKVQDLRPGEKPALDGSLR